MVSTSPEEHLANANTSATSVDTAATPSPSSPPPPPGKGKKQGSVADRVAWLQSAFAKDADSPSKRDLGLESVSTSVSDRKRWMEEGAFRKHLEDRGYVVDGSDVSGASLVEERRRWLHEQAERNRLENERNQINKGGGSPRGAGNANAATNKSEASKAEEEDKVEAEDSAEPPVLVDEEEEETEPTPPAKNDEEQNGEENAETEASAVAAAAVSPSEEEPEPTPLAKSDEEQVGEEGAETEASAVVAAAVVSPSPQRPSSQDPPTKTSNFLTKTTASTMNRATETDGRVGSPAARAMPCLFSSPVFAQQRDQMEFFLPAACSCPKCRAELAAAAPADEVAGTVQDPTALQTILRPWQGEFLKEEGIETAGGLVDVEKDADRRQRLCRHMKRWRKERDLPAKTISCLMAVRIWAKTSEEALKNANASSTSAK